MTPDTPVTWSASRFLGLFGHLRRNEILRDHAPFPDGADSPPTYLARPEMTRSRQSGMSVFLGPRCLLALNVGRLDDRSPFLDVSHFATW